MADRRQIEGMRELTSEIDLRPLWLQSLRKKPGAKTLRIAAGGTLALIIVVYAFGRDPKPSELAVAGVSSGETTHEEAKVLPVKDDAPIVIHATPELVPESAGGLGERAEPGARAHSERGPQAGTLEIASEPPVQVYEGEKRLGKTPLKVKLEAGVHELRLVSKSRHLEVKRKVEIRAGGEHKRDWMLGVGSLRVRAPEGTKLWLNKKYAGSAPFKALELAEGRHRIKLKRGVEVVEEWIDVPASQTIDYRVNFSE